MREQQSSDFLELNPEKIEIENPKKGGFYNPRSKKGTGGFSKRNMDELYRGVRDLGLQNPLLVRRNGNVYSLIAGERRLLTILRLKKENCKCYNLHNNKTELAKKVYGTIPCRVIECSDEEAFAFAMEENDNSVPLTVGDHVAIVDKFKNEGKTPQTIAKILHKHESWISQTLSFKKLPEDCFKQMCLGQVSRYIGTKLLEYPQDKREQIWEAAKGIMSMQADKLKQILRRRIEEAELAAENAAANAEVSKDLENEVKAEEYKELAEEELDNKELAEEELDNLDELQPTGGTIDSAAENIGIKQNTPRAFNKKKIEQHYIEPLLIALEEGKLDEETGKEYPPQALNLALVIAQGIAERDSDVFRVIRKRMITSGKWTVNK